MMIFPKLKTFSKKNYPPFVLEKIIKAYIDKIHYSNNKVSSEVNKLKYFKLPYIGKYSEQVQKKQQNCVNNIAKKIMSKLCLLHLK